MERDEFLKQTIERVCRDFDALDEPEWKKEKLKQITRHLLTTPEGLEQLKQLKEILYSN